MSLTVSEIFYSVGGEGISVGKPAYFIRVVGCSLRCTYCDTPYALEGGMKMSDEFILSELTKLGFEDKDTLVVTGGEPLLYQDDLRFFIGYLRSLRDVRIEIETNGTIFPNERLIDLVDVFNASPKLSNSGNDIKNINKDTIKKFAELGNSIFKFVVEKEEDMQEVLDIIKDCKIYKERVFLMPQARTRVELLEKGLIVVELCKKYKLRYGERLHIFLWNNERSK